MNNVESGKPVHCVELVTGKNFTGWLEISGERIRSSIFSYGEAFNIQTEKPLLLLAETNNIASLHSCITGGVGHNSRNIEPRRTIYQQEIISNLAVVGHDPWTEDDRVRRVTFKVNHTNALMRHNEKVSVIGREKYPEDDHFTIFDHAANGMTLKAYYVATYGMEFDAPKDLWPVFEIEFEVPLSIEDYIKHVSDYVAFLSFCLGAYLKPSAIHVDRLSSEEMKSALERRAYPGNHEVHYVWPEVEVDKRSLWVGGSPVRAWDDEELMSLRACLVAWMNRAPEWKKAYALMMGGFRQKNVISGERLLNACRWFDDIPIAQADTAISDGDIESISTIAGKKAESLGYPPNIRERVAGAIKWVKMETAEERFRRVVAMVEGRFGKGILEENVVTHLKRAIQFRGRAAHGHFNPESDAEFRAFAKSVRAMEVLSYLLLAVDLPISREGIGRIRSNPIVEDYRLS